MPGLFRAICLPQDWLHIFFVPEGWEWLWVLGLLLRTQVLRNRFPGLSCSPGEGFWVLGLRLVDMTVDHEVPEVDIHKRGCSFQLSFPPHHPFIPVMC